MIREIALQDLTTAKRAIVAHVDRIELNSRLDLGGLTPDLKLVKQVYTLANQEQVELVVMVRPRAGDFVYNNAEFEEMKATILALKTVGISTVTFGILTKQNHLDEQRMTQLIQLAKPMQVVMHMAFDDLSDDAQLPAIDWLVQQGVQRILMHGGQLSEPITETLPKLKQTIIDANGRIEILPGGGITYENAEHIAQALACLQVHGSKIVRLD
ncbi:copper homeostasis protein CutC [Weissella diestrammenae]|uniref:PF03932 family protein CutC n=1 Tax=Weissella diestrammenae TaxID=1162633 RepID=A0A7G9T430_9LACO|nr:copper homeostasis protein CutC [Weissella diestrammenae]MCM0583377.1 copper homeostasis protein CutC [Weissella diestrammenae]QNN74855.1 copper homeostasis protein CutC [Weissella diestrammenae]